MGRHKTGPRTIGAHVPDEMYQQLAAIARARGERLADLVRRIAQREIEEMSGTACLAKEKEQDLPRS